MKIAFTSCFDARKDDSQQVWTQVRAQQPDALLLLGDNIYMDFGFTLNRPRRWKPKKFADKMYERYLAQSKVASFRKLINTVQQVGITWDDHDFAWNNTYSIGGGKNQVPDDKRLISRGLHMQFRDWLRDTPLSAKYPAQPSMAALLAGPDEGIQEAFDVGSVRVVMTDGRSFRERQNSQASSSQLGKAQKKWIAKQINGASGLSLLCSGSVLARGKESWELYNDLAWLAAQQFSNTLVLSGDIHKNAMQTHKALDNLLEVTSSGAARPGLGGDSGNFGLLDVSGKKVEISLFGDKGLEMTKSL